VAVSAAIVVLVSLAAFAIVSAWQARVLADERRNIGRSLALQQRYAEALPWMYRAISNAEPGVGAVVMRAQRALILHRLGRRETTAEIASAIESLERLSSPETARRLASAQLLLGRILS
jgi:hypothetical protein